jgi:hypothetical protein
MKHFEDLRKPEHDVAKNLLAAVALTAALGAGAVGTKVVYDFNQIQPSVGYNVLDSHDSDK